MLVTKLPVLLAAAAIFASDGTAQTQLHLTEFLARNDTGIVDVDGDRSDWLEIHNSSSAAVNLAGWRLTDDGNDPIKWVFPAETLPGGGYLIIWASGKDRAVAGQQLHTSFRLTTAGEYLALIRPDGLVATEYAPAYPVQSPDISYGLEADLTTRSYFDPPTPGAANQPGGQLLQPITFSRPHGLVDNPFTLTLTHPNPSAVLRYTLDGREPTPADTAYSAPILVDEITTIRVRAFAPGFLPSAIVSSTWIFPGDVVQQDLARALAQGMPSEWIDQSGANWTLAGTRPGASYGLDGAVIGAFSAQEIRDNLRALPTVSLLIHPDDLFGYMAPSGRDGIYANSREEGPLWERACSVEWIDPNGGPEFTITCGTNIQGGSSTAPSLRGQLSFALKFKAEYGPTKLEFQVFEDAPVEEYDYLVFDSGNQLAISGNAGTTTKMHAQETRDEFISDVHERMRNLSPFGRWVHLYLNGLYWGVYHLHDRPDERFAAAHGSGEVEEYDWVKRGEVLEGNDNDVNTAAPGMWREVRDIVTNGVAPGSMWRGVDAYEALAQRVDLAGYSDYLLSHWYGGNTDWPNNNWMATAHARNSGDPGDVNPDGRFAFHNWDAEATLYWEFAAIAVNDGFWDRTGIQSNSFRSAVFIHTAALQHPDYRILLADRAQRHLLTEGGALWVEPGFNQPGTVYDPSHPERNVPASMYFRIASELGPAVLMEYARWGNYFHAPGEFDPSDWVVERDRLLNDYFPIRSGVLLQQLRAASPQLFPDLGAPETTLASGTHARGTRLALTQPQGATIYYTLDGTDPRQSLGSIDPLARVAGAPLALPRGVHELRARSFDGSNWSALLERTYVVGFKLRINEVQAQNVSTVADPSGEFEDWIELRNLTDGRLQLGGFHLTDDPLDPTKYRIPAGVSIDPGGRLVFWADEDTAQGDLHLNFKLAGGGEYVGLFAPMALENAAIDEVDYPAQNADRAFARIPDGRGPFRPTALPTPDAPNRLRDRPAR